MTIIEELKLKRFFMLVTVALSALFCQVASAQVTYSSYLPPGAQLNRGDMLKIPGGSYMLTLQATDGNLVVYRLSDMKPIWSAGTDGKGGVLAIIQNDGNFSVYNSAWVSVWNSATGGHPVDAYKLHILSDGSLQIYADGKSIIWRTTGDTVPPSCPGGQPMSLYPICVKGNNQSIPACSTADATQYAHSIGGVYGPCR